MDSIISELFNTQLIRMNNFRNYLILTKKADKDISNEALSIIFANINLSILFEEIIK